MAVALRLTEQAKWVLAALAAEQGISRHEAALRAIDEVADWRGHTRSLSEASASVRARYADMLDRLGQ